MWEKIKQHPWIVGGAVGLLLLVLVYSSSSSTSSTAGATTATDSSNGDQIAAYMASLNQQGQIAQLAAGVQSQNTAAGVTVAQLQASSTDNANTLAAQVAEFETSIAGSTQQNKDTLSAQVAENTNATNLGIVNSNNSASVQQSQIFANTVVTQSNNQTAQTLGYINALPGIIGAQQAPALAQANKSCSSFLFGLFSSC